jgi:tetratricopeptide (TPR) repeat protein
MPHRMTQAAVAVYALLHLAGWYWPAELWGVDQLHYYGSVVALAFAALCVSAIAAGHSQSVARLDRRAVLTVRSLHLQARYANTAKVVGLLSCVGLAYLLRVREHLLGDSDKWFQLLGKAPDLSQIISTLGHGELPTLPEVPLFESLDFLLHLGVYLILHPLFGWSESDAYLWLSLLAGAFYVAALWRLAPLLTQGAAEQATVLLLGLCLGSAQLFLGYGESYTLVAAATTWFFVHALLGLRGASLARPTAVLMLCLALHMMSIGLLPAWVYLAWVKAGRPMRTAIRSPRVWVLLVTPAVLVGGVLYVYVYPYALPLLPSASVETHSLFAGSHLALMGNAILLISPFGLLWGASLHHRARHAPAALVLLWASVGTGAVVFLTDASLGGRDWDMLSYPALCYSLWGIASLHVHPRRRSYLRILRWTVIPIVSCHTLLWVGINASEDRALARLENLLQYANLPEHYRHWTLGFYYTNILEQQYDKAVYHFTAAVTATPPDVLLVPHTRPYSYRKFLAISLGLNDQLEACVEQSRAIYAMQTEPVLDVNDLALQQQYGEALLKLAQQADDDGAPAVAEPYWRESLAPVAVMARETGDPLHYWNLSSAHRRLGNHVQSIEDFRRSLAMSDSPGPDMIALGDLYLKGGAQQLAATAYAQLLHPEVAGVTSEDYKRTGIRLYKVRSSARIQQRL